MAGSTAAFLAIGMTPMSAAIAYISLHTADPGTTGASEVPTDPYDRQAVAFTVTGGDAEFNADVDFTLAQGQVIAGFGFWTAVTAGTFRTGGLFSSPITIPSVGVTTLRLNAGSLLQLVDAA